VSSASLNSGNFQHHAGLLLQVARADGHFDEFYLASGLTIGRSMANTVVLADDESVDRTHARVEVADDGVATLRCIELEGFLTTGVGPAHELSLAEGVRFRVGGVDFECVPGRRMHGEGRDRALASCPFCDSRSVATEGEDIRQCPGCGSPLLPVRLDPPEPARLLVPVTYGPYQADRYVARGGMGLVLKGTRECGTEPVAIKIFPPGMHAEPREAEQFEQEMAMLARVRHHHVVKLLDCGKSGRFHFLALEWIEGPSLRRVIDDANRMGELTDFKTAIGWFEQVCKGLAAIHAAGMVHRDIKPSNILIGPDGAARVADLGIAKQVDATRASDTTIGHVPGTFEYMAPEQLTSPDLVDGRADLYALGVTFYDLLTGTRPVSSWQNASKINPSVSPAFDGVLVRLLELRADRRPDDVYDLLASFAAIQPVSMNRQCRKTIGNPMVIEASSSPRRAADATDLFVERLEVVSVLHCIELASRPILKWSRKCWLSWHDTSSEVGRGRSLSLLLPEFSVPRSRGPRWGKPLGLRSLRPGQLDPLPPMSLLRRSVLRTQGHPAVPFSPDQGESHRRP
jgi:serine/threonine protein kinase